MGRFSARYGAPPLTDEQIKALETPADGRHVFGRASAAQAMPLDFKPGSLSQPTPAPLEESEPAEPAPR
jgi:hypothetical protein